MPNDYFQFKQFTIQQANCAMKVCTDSCLFGAYIAQFIQNKEVNLILDIGAGTGLLSLMLAQTSNAIIDAIEIEPNAYQQAKENIANSSWKERINVIEGDIRTFQLSKKYDLIISNPPFYEHNLKSSNESKNIALHNNTLDIATLTSIVKNALLPTGVFAVLLPFFRLEEMIEIAQKSELHLAQQITIAHSPKHTPYRVILIFSLIIETVIYKEHITIESSPKQYSPQFIALLQPYYLSL